MAMPSEDQRASESEIEAPATVGAAMKGYFINGRLVQEQDPDWQSKPESAPQQEWSSEQEVAEFLCDMCKDIPPPSSGGWWTNFKNIMRIAFSRIVGVGLEELSLPDGVSSFHDLKAQLILDKEVQRASREWPELLNVDDDLCFPLSLLSGRCVLVVNVASK